MNDDLDIVPDPVGYARNVLAEIEQGIAESPSPDDIPEIVYFAKHALKGLLDSAMEGFVNPEASYDGEPTVQVLAINDEKLSKCDRVLVIPLLPTS